MKCSYLYLYYCRYIELSSGETQLLTVWGRKTSSNVQALMWCIGELGLPYQRYDIGHRYGGTDTDEFYRLNPNRTVPVLQDGCNTH